ncbi:hypothetical protein Dimus_014076, partial [Dionaea muscipula]
MTSQRPTLYDHRPLQLNEDDYQRVCQIPKEKDILESFQGTEFFYMEQAGNRSLYSSLSFRNKVVQRQDEKWWLPIPCLPK